MTQEEEQDRIAYLHLVESSTQAQVFTPYELPESAISTLARP